MKEFQFNLVESELKIVLESITEMEAKVTYICETSTDEDEIADSRKQFNRGAAFIKSS